MKHFRCAMVLMGVACAMAAYAAPFREQTIAPARLVKAARAALPAATKGLTVTTRVLGAPPAATVPEGKVRLQTHSLVGRWPRARVAVQVVVVVNGKPARTETIWFAVRALRLAWVYDQDTPAGTAMSKLKVHETTVDVAKADGRLVHALAVLTGDRLKRGVHAGWPLLMEDFEPTPDVDSQSKVLVHVRYGSIRMEATAKALGTGNVGDVVPVLVEGAVSPVMAKVAGRGVVDIAR